VPAAQCLSLLQDALRFFMKIRFSAALCLGLAGGFLSLSSAQAAQELPVFERVKASHISSDALLLDRHGEPLSDVRLNPDVRRLPWVDVQTLSPAMREALLAAEDKRFFEHTGIDWKAFLGAAWQNLWGHTRRGASTLTMQLAGLLEPELRLPGKGTARRNLSQKWDQSLAALELEKHWSKEQILEAYLNLAPFRGDIEGIGAASQILLGVAPQDITLREATILAALLRGPNAKPALVAHRACILAELLKDRKACAQISQLALSRLDAPRNVPRFALAPQLARDLLRKPGQQLSTTIDAGTQRNVLATASHTAAIAQLHDASVMVIDNASGEVLAWVGALQTHDPDGLLARQPLSQWWLPYAVELGIEQRTHTAVSLLIDARNVLDAKDAHAGYSAGVASLRLALQNHNTGLLREQQREMLRDVGGDIFNDRLRQLGLDVPLNPDGMASEISASQLIGAWHALSTGASYVPVSALPPDPAMVRRVVPPAAGFITQDMLADNFTGGWRSSWTTASLDGHQQIVVGNTDSMTVLVSVTRPSRPDDLARNAQQLWKDVVTKLQKAPSRGPAAPDGTTSSIVVFEPPDEPVRRDWFLKGTEFDRAMVEALPTGGRIKVPQQGRSYTISTADQPWILDAAIARATRWQMDGNVMGQGAQTTWTPSPGHHHVALLGPRDEVMDAADFDVTY
jgi:penicillin-binding protein 1C